MTTTTTTTTTISMTARCRTRLRGTPRGACIRTRNRPACRLPSVGRPVENLATTDSLRRRPGRRIAKVYTSRACPGSPCRRSCRPPPTFLELEPQVNNATDRDDSFMLHFSTSCAATTHRFVLILLLQYPHEDCGCSQTTDHRPQTTDHRPKISRQKRKQKTRHAQHSHLAISKNRHTLRGVFSNGD
jgi:hypothetical protein